MAEQNSSGGQAEEEIAAPSSSSSSFSNLTEVCSHLAASNASESQRFASFAMLPHLFNSMPLDASQLSSVVRALPVEFLAKLLTNEDYSAESIRYEELALAILSNLLPRTDSVDLPKFKPVVGPLVSLVEEKSKQQPLEQLESVLSLLVRLSSIRGLVSPAMINRLLDLIFKQTVKTTEKWPSASLLGAASQLLNALAAEELEGQEPCDEQGTEEVHRNLGDSLDKAFDEYPKRALSWPSDSRLLIERLLRTKHLPDKYRNLVWTLIRDINSASATCWFCVDAEFLTLVAAMTTVQLRCVLDRPDQVDVPALITCVSLVELFANDCVAGDRLDDRQATRVTQHVVEAASFVGQYFVAVHEAEGGQNVAQLGNDAKLVLYRFLCGYLTTGGGETLREQLTAIVDPVFNFAKEAVESGDWRVAALFVDALEAFPRLPVATLVFLSDFIGIVPSENDKRESICKVTDVIVALSDRSDWYDAEGLRKARELADKLKQDEAHAFKEALRMI